MKILITIPHYYKYQPGNTYGSSAEKRESRVKALRDMLVSLRGNFSLPHSIGKQEYEDRYGTPVYVNYETADLMHKYEIDICICTTEEDHLIHELNLPYDFFQWKIFSIGDPRYLGFACHHVLKENKGKYDYYAFMEDDLIIHDLFFFQKLQWFEDTFGSEYLLQPYRYQMNAKPFYKEYIDPRMANYIEYFIDFSQYDKCELKCDFLGRELRFQPSRNPHSGCFFVSAKQYDIMSSRTDYAIPTDAFCGPMECAASWDIMHSFTIYQPDLQQGSFFEIEHVGKKPPRAPRSRVKEEFFESYIGKYGFQIM